MLIRTIPMTGSAMRVVDETLLASLKFVLDPKSINPLLGIRRRDLDAPYVVRSWDPKNTIDISRNEAKKSF